MNMFEDEELRKNFRQKVKNDYNLDLSEEDVTLGLIEQEKKQVSIFHNQIYPNRRSRKVRGSSNYEYFISWDLTIDGARAIAHRHGLCGIDKPVFTTLGDLPDEVEVTVYRRGPRGERYPFTGSVRYNEFVQKTKDKNEKWVPNHMWRTKPFNQLAKCAEAQALRKGFQEIGQDDPFLIELDETPIEDTSEATIVPISTGESATLIEDVPFAYVPKYKAGDVFNEEIIVNHWIVDGNFEELTLQSGIVVKVFPDGKTDIQFPTQEGPGRNYGPPQNENPSSIIVEEKTIDSQRALALPLLKKWCEEKNDGKKLSYKAAYEELVGVVIKQNTEMSINDYDVLIAQLQDSLAGKNIDTSQGINA